MDGLLDARHATATSLAFDNLAALRSAAAQSAKLKEGSELACLACSCCSTSPNHKMSMMKSSFLANPMPGSSLGQVIVLTIMKAAVTGIAAKLQPLHKADAFKVEP